MKKNRIQFLADDQEKAIIEKAAKSAGMQVGTYVRMAALEKARKENA